MKPPLSKRPKKLPSIRKHYLSLLLLIIFATFGFLALRYQVAPLQAETPITRVAAEFDKILIPTPTRAIAKGERLDQVEFREVTWPKDSLSREYVQSAADLKRASALTSLPAYLPVPVSAISYSGIDANAVVERIPQGLRAITLTVDAEAAVEGWARSGNYVDVILLRQSKQDERGIEAKVIAENVKILSAGQSTEPLNGQPSAPRPPATVTLLVNQENALKIKTASSIGKLTFSLRGAGDESPTVSLTMDQKTLTDGAKHVSKSAEAFYGTAKGPDGKIYTLANNSRWIRKLEDSGAPKPERDLIGK